MKPQTRPLSAVKQDPAPPAEPARMTLSAVRRGRHREPDRVFLYGVEGVGKSTWAASAPDAIFISTEQGTAELDVERFPEPTTFNEVLEAIRTLADSDHSYKTLAIDTMDWVGFLIIDEVLRRNSWSPEDFDKYGRGYKVWIDDWRKLLVELESLQRKKGMEVILLAHANITNFKNPAGEDYMRYTPKIGGEAAASILKEWSKSVLFSAYEELTTDPNKGRVKGISTGQRIIYTERTAAYDAKNRFNLPPILPLDYSEYATARAAFFSAGGTADPDALLAECTRLADLLKEPADSIIRKYAIDNKGNRTALTAGLNRLRVLATEAGVA